jgi:hypothetical protein
VCNGIDDNCDEQIDEGVKLTFYHDMDIDGYGNPNPGHSTEACTAPAGYVSNSADCDDTNNGVNPGAAEVCNNVDDNCNAQVDEGVLNTYYQDADSDGYGNLAVTTQACTAPAGYVSNSADCDDTSASVNPGAADIPGNGIDENCDGADGINPLTVDDDSDGFSENQGDCDDTNANINPNAIDIPGNAIDENCDLVYVGNPASVTLHLSNNIIQTSGAGGSVDAECFVYDANNVPIHDSFFDIFTDALGATENPLGPGWSRFGFPESGEFGIHCQESVLAMTSTETVVVLDDSINPLYSSFNNHLENISDAIDAAIAADTANDLPAVQAAKNTIQTEMLSLNLAGMASNPPMPTGGDVPTDAELLAAGDAPNPAVDNPFKDTIIALEQNFIDYQNLVSGLTPATITQADIDNMNALTAAGNALAAALEGMAPSHTAILAVNTELNNLVSNLVPNQTATVTQMMIDVLGTIPGIVKLNHELPLTFYAGLKTDGREPMAFYSETKETFLAGLMMSQSIANGLRSQYIKQVYKPIMKHIAKNLWFLRNQNLGPFGLNPPVLDFVFGPGASAIFEGGDIEVWGSNFAPVLGNNTIRVSTTNGDFEIVPYALMLDSGGFDILNGTLPTGMSDHPFGLFGFGVVRVITPGGTSNGIEVNIFP